MNEKIFKIFKKGAIILGMKYDFNALELEDAFKTFQPIIEIQTFTINEINDYLEDLKSKFINENKVFDLDIFSRNNFDYLEYDLNHYLICFERGKFKIWKVAKGKYFYHLKLESERETPSHQTLLISDKNEIQIEIYFKGLIDAIKKFKSPINLVQNEYELSDVLKSRQESVDLLKEIWLPEPKLTVNDFLNKGIECGVWNKNYEIILNRGSVYGSGKSFLGSLSVALKSYSISNNTNYEVIGKAFCQAFKIDNFNTSSNPYKSFQAGNKKYIKELKRAFNIR